MKNFSLVIAFLLLSCNVYAQKSVWESGIISTTQKQNPDNPQKSIQFKLDAHQFVKQIKSAPSRFSVNQSQVIIELPNELGMLERYQMYEASNFHPELAAKFPSIKSYIAKGINNSATARISYAPSHGLQVAITNLNRETTLIKPLDLEKNIYSVFSMHEINSDLTDFECETIAEYRNSSASFDTSEQRNANDSNLRLYRAVISTTGEFSQFFLDGTEVDDIERKAKVLAAINSSLTRINGIFERDFSVSMQLIANNEDVIYLDPASDPYLIDNSVLQNTLDTNIGDSNYDVGHLFGYEGNIYGNAGCIACVCTPGQKGSGYTVHSAPDSDHFNMIASHEFGHQFGGWHVQSSSNCRSSNELQEVEPGSGSTIMGYAGICPSNVQDSPDDYFNYVDIRDVAEWTINGSSCAQLISIANTAPTANAGNDFMIPISTAFILEGQGDDVDNDQLSFCWEENDPENPFSSQPPSPTRTQGPMFRSKLPVLNPDRYMPQIDDVIVGNITPTWEVVPSIGRTMDFVLTVRDNALGGGQTASDEMTVTVDANSGPFTVTSQSTPESWDVGSNATINWDVAGTNVAPINATEVDILLSVDGGYTYPYTLIENTLNDGTQSIIIPNVPTTSQARVMVRASNNIFYALNSSDIDIQTSEFLMSFDETTISVCQPDDAVYNFTYNTFLGFNETTTFSAEGLPNGALITFNPNTATIDDTDVEVVISNTQGIALGNHDITIKGNSASVEKSTVISLFVYDSTIDSPSLTYPSDGETGVNINDDLTWLEDVNANSYQIQVATDVNFNNIITDLEVFSNSQAVSGLDYNTTYFWRVKSINQCGESDYSNTYSFVTFCIAPSNLTVVNPDIDALEIGWLENGNATSWEIEVVPSGNAATGIGTLVTSNPYLYSGLNSSTAYDIYVRSICSASNSSEWIGPISYTTLADFCTGDHFYDSGGENGNYTNGEDITTVIIPTVGFNSVTVTFNSFELEGCCDFLSVYDGLDVNAPLLGQFNGTTNPGSFTSNNSSGALTFRFTSDGSVTYSGWDATVICESISCPNPSNITASNITTNSLDLSWDIGFDETAWEIEYGLVGFSQGAGTVLQVMTNPYSLSGLDYNTEYDFYIRANCGANPGDDDSSWIGPISFTTQNINPPSYLTAVLSDQELGTVDLNWGEPVGIVGRWLLNYDHSCVDSYAQAEIVFNSDGTFYVPLDGSSGTWELLGDQVTWTFDNGFQYFGTLTGNHMEGVTSSNGCWFADFISVDYNFQVVVGEFTPNNEVSENANTFVTINSTNSTNYAFLEYNLYRDGLVIAVTTETTYIDTLPDYGIYDYYVTAMYDEGESQPSNIETVEWVSCIEPSDLLASNVTPNSADLSWIAGSDEASWEIEYGFVGFSQGAGTVLQVMTNPYNLTGLDSNTEYDFYIRANCGANPGDDDSNWVGPISFTTLSDFCNGDHFYDSGGVNGNYTNGEDITTVITPTTGFNSVTVTFNSFELEGCCDYLSVYDGLDVNAPLLGQFNGTTNPGSFTSNNPAGALTFRFTSDGSVVYSGWDATVVCENITCPNPSDILVSNVTTSSADLSWTVGSSETSWEIEYGFVGFSQGAGTVLQVMTNPYSLTGLDYNTEYDFYIRANCGANPGDDDSSWIGPLNFTTQNISAPGYLTAVLTDQELGTVDLNWGEPGGIVGQWLLNYDHGCTNSYSQAEIIFYDDGSFEIPSEGNFGTWELVGDQMTWTYNDGFQYFGTLTGDHMEGVTSSNGCWFADKIADDYNLQVVVGELMSNGHVSENANTVNTINSTNSTNYAFIEYNVYRDGLVIAVTTETTYIDTLPDYGIYDYYVTAVYDEGESQPSNIETVEWVSCVDPTNLLVANITSDSADLSWTAGSSETAWEIEYGFVGFSQGTGTVLQVMSNPYNLTGLDSNTEYDFYIRANCGANPGDDDSNWVGPITFTTYLDFCNGDHFYDSGGANGSYTDGEDITTVITPTAGYDSVTVTFNSFELEGCCDYLSVYDGLDINAPLLGQFNGTTNPGTFTSNNPDGALTFRFTSDGSVVYSGWDATVSCQTLSTAEFDFEGLEYYPNPVTDVFNVSYTREITSIEIYNIVGQNIMSMKPKTNAVKLDFSEYASGAYFVKLWVDNNFKIVKLIKK